MRTSAAVARSTTSSLVNLSAPRVLSRRANSCTLIICSHILGSLLTQRNRRFDRLFLRPPRQSVSCLLGKSKACETEGRG
jgi:hypothetical protein